MSDTYVPSDFYGSYNEEHAQAQYEQGHELANRVQYVTQVAPYLADDPEVLAAVAQLNVPTDQLGYLAGSVSAQMRLDGTRSDLERMEPGRARRVFATLTQAQQDALRQAGYQPADDDNGGSNPLLSMVGTVGRGVLGGVNTVLTETPVVSDVFDIMNKLDNGVKTLYRAIRTDEQAALATLGAVVGGLVAAPFTGGLSLGVTAGAIGAAGLAAGTAVAALTNPGDYIDALDDNWNGEAVFSRGAQQRARTLLQTSGLDVMARDIGWEMDAYETVKLFASTPDATSEQQFMGSIERVLDRIAEPGDPRRESVAAKLVELIQIPQFREAVTILQHSKVSFGRDMARLAGAAPGTGTFSLLSGAMDGLFTVVMDPTLAAGSAARWNRARRLGVPLGDGDEVFDTINAIARRANEVPTIGAAYDEIANAVNTNQPHLLWRRVREAKGMYDDLWNYKQLKVEAGEMAEGAFTRDDIFDWLRQGTNYQTMLAGHGVKQGYGRLLLPTYGWRIPFTQETINVNRVLEGAKAVIDFADDAGNRAHLAKVGQRLKDLGQQYDAAAPSIRSTDRLQGALRYSVNPDEEWSNLRSMIDVIDTIPVLNKVMRVSGSVMASFTEMMPATRSISMVGPQAAEDIQRFVALGRAVGMTSIERKGWFDTIMQQDNIEHRINAAMSYLDTMLSAGGVRSTEKGAELADRFLTKVRHRYSLGDADQYLLGQRTVSRGIHPYQHTFDLPIPDLKELRQFAEKGLLLKYLYRVVDNDISEVAINRIWKPAVILRLGFITRAGGEELLAHLARSGPSAMLNEFGARAIAEGRLHVSAQQAARQMGGLDAAQIHAIERMRYVAHVRPLERMFANWNWSSPIVEVLGRWSDFVRMALERGIAPGLVDRIPASRQLALLGKENGLRRSLLLGVDPKMIRYAEAFGRTHAASIMREVSAHNANFWNADNRAAETDFRIKTTNAQGEQQELGFAIERGVFRTYRRGDPVFDRAAHGGVSKILNDEVTGPIYVQVTSRWAPDSLTNQHVYSHLSAYRSIADWRVRSVVDELLTHTDSRTTNWESMLRSLDRSEPVLAAKLRARHRSLGEDPAEARAVLKTLREWSTKAFPGRGPSGLSRYGEQVGKELQAAELLLDSLDSVGSMERSWLGSFLDHWGRLDETPPLIRGFDDYRSELAERLIDRHADPEIQPLVQDLSYVNRLDDGTFVAAPPREGRTRLWIPQVTAETYGRLLGELRDAGPQQVVNRLMALWGEAQPHLAGLHIGQADEMLRRFLTRMALEDPTKLARHAADVASGGRHGDLIPLAHMGFDDPDVAQRFSQFLNGTLSRQGGELTMAGRMRDNRGYVAIVDLDDRIKSYTPMDIDGARRPVAQRQWQTRVTLDETGAWTTERVLPRETERVIHSWALDREYLTPRTVSMADEQLVELPDGSRHFGADPREAVRQGVDKQVVDWLQHVGPGTTQQRVVRGTVYADPNQAKQIPVGSHLTVREDAYDAKGRLLEYDDPDAFSLLDARAGAGVHENWSMLGPLLRDATDHFNGTARILPDTRPIRNLPDSVLADRANAAPLEAPNAREFRGHWSHVQDLANPPQVAVGPSMVPIESPGRLDQIFTFGFERVINPAIDAIIRRPLAFHMFAEAMQENERAMRWGLSSHLFGDDSTGQVGELQRRFGHILDTPEVTADVEALASDLLAAARVLSPAEHAQLVGAEPLQIVNTLLGKYADDNILQGSLRQQIKSAKDYVRSERADLIYTRIENAPPQSSVRRTIRGIQDQTEQDMVRLVNVPRDPANPLKGGSRWEPAADLGAIQPGQYVVDVPASEVSSSIAKFNRQGIDAPGSVRLSEAEPFQPTRRLTEREVVDGMRRWMGTGKRPAGWDQVLDTTQKRLAKQLQDLRADTDTFEMLGDFTLGEWDEAMAAAERTIDTSRWAINVWNNERPIEGLLDAYADQLGDVLSRSWGEASRLVVGLPGPLRDALNEQSWAVLSAAYRNKSKLGETIESLAADRAIRNTMPYLDSHEIRSQAGEYVRGFFPFMYAEENFLKRWARTLKVAPDALRKGQLIYAGLKSGGVIRTDSQGRDWFVYPGAGLVAETINRATQSIGFGEVMPSGVVFAAQTKNMLPGFDIERTGMPSANPLIAVPLGGITSMFHELRPIQEALVGQAGVSQGGVAQFIPTSIRRFWDVAGDEDSNVKYASAMMSAIAVLEHNGHGLPDGATANQLDDYIRRVRNHTRGILAAQAFVGFIVPGAPSIQYTGESALSTANLTGLNAEIPADVFRAEYLQMIQELGIEDGTIAYFELNPDHDINDLMAFTVGQSTSTSGAPLPASHESVRFADENQGFIEQYPMASAWLLPQTPPGKEEFDEYAYVQQSISGLRQKRTPTEFLEALKYREGSFDYFRARERHEVLMAESEGDPMRRRQLEDVWATFKSQHLAMHPVFGEQLEGGEARQRRARVLDELRTAIEDPGVPQVGHLSSVRDLMQTFDLYQVTLGQLSTARSAEAQDRVERYKLMFEDIVTDFLFAHPELEPLWLSVLRPEANL